MIRKIGVPAPFHGLGFLSRRHRFIAWVTFYGWQPRYLLAEDWLLAPVPGEWMQQKEFERHTGLVRPEEYRVDWLV
jgi:hypothetical protein